MRKKTGAITAAAAAALMVGLGVAPAHAATCNTGNLCSYDANNYGGTTWQGGNGDFVEVPDDVTNSAQNKTSKNYNAKNNTAFGQEETLAYIPAGANVSSFSGNNNKIDHYRKA